MDNLYKELDAIIEGISNDLPNRLKLRKFYREAGKILSKSPEFFYERDKKKQEEMFKNYDVIKNHEVICKSVVHLYSKYLKKLGIDAFPYEMDDVEGIKFNHWGASL